MTTGHKHWVALRVWTQTLVTAARAAAEQAGGAS